MLLPNWFYINIYEMSSWTRGIVIPMAIFPRIRPDWRLPEHAQSRRTVSRILAQEGRV